MIFFQQIFIKLKLISRAAMDLHIAILHNNNNNNITYAVYNLSTLYAVLIVRNEYSISIVTF